MAGLDPAIHVFVAVTRKTWMPGTRPGMTEVEQQNMLDDFRITLRSTKSSLRYDGWRIVVVCFLLATFGWGLGFYGQSVYVAELHRLHGWPASLISSGTTFFYLFGRAAGRLCQRGDPSFGPRNCLIAGTLCDGGGCRRDRPGHASPGSSMPPMRCWRSAGPAPASA